MIFKLIKVVVAFLSLFSSFTIFAQNQSAQPLHNQPGKAQEKLPPLTSHVILVTVDGLGTDVFNNPKASLPTLKSLRNEGAVVLNLEGVYPTQSSPSYATIVTGMFPSDHGVVSDVIFDEEKGVSSTTKYQKASEIKAESIWQTAKRNGLKTAAINVPLVEAEVIDIVSNDINSAFEVVEKNAPHFLMINYTRLVQPLQNHGSGSSAVNTALEEWDDYLKKLNEAVNRSGRKDSTTLVILSSYGFIKVDQEFRPNIVLAKKGLLSLDHDNNISSWVATTRSFGGSAAVYVKDRQNEETTKVIESIFEELHKKEGSPIWRIINKKDVTRLGADPRAVFFLEAAPGIVFSEQVSGKKLIENIQSSKRTEAGYLPSRSEMRGWMIQFGQGTKAKKRAEYARLVDVAPTIARLLGLQLKAARGHAISEILLLPNQK